jgi:DNA-binding NarL/FixJ family response regulator
MGKTVLLLVGPTSNVLDLNVPEIDLQRMALPASEGPGDELEQAVERGNPRLVITVVDGQNDFGTVDRVLWTCSKARRPVPVVVVDRVYDECKALRYFQMGVSDYLSLSDHHDGIDRVVARLLSREHSLALPSRDETKPEHSGRSPKPARSPVSSRSSS